MGFYCSQCGSQLSENMKFCSGCGAPVVTESDIETATEVSAPIVEDIKTVAVETEDRKKMDGESVRVEIENMETADMTKENNPAAESDKSFSWSFKKPVGKFFLFNETFDCSALMGKNNLILAGQERLGRKLKANFTKSEWVIPYEAIIKAEIREKTSLLVMLLLALSVAIAIYGCAFAPVEMEAKLAMVAIVAWTIFRTRFLLKHYLLSVHLQENNQVTQNGKPLGQQMILIPAARQEDIAPVVDAIMKKCNAE